MRVYQIGTLLVVGALLVTFQNCAKQGDIASSTLSTVDSSQMQKSMASLRSEINVTSARDLSCVADSDCVALAVGAAHCGSPTFYVVSSVKSADYADVVALAAQFKDVEQNYMSASQLVASCEATAPPQSSCLENRCVRANGL